MPLNANQVLRRAKVSTKRGAFDDARRHYQAVLKQYPESKRARDGLRALPAASFGVTSQLDAQIKILLALHSESKFEEAYTHGIKLAEKNSNVPAIHNILGVISSSLGKLDEAVASFKKAIEINPDYASAHISLGNVLNSSGKHDEAIDSFNNALAIDPGLAEAQNSLASIFRAAGRHEDALKSFL